MASRYYEHLKSLPAVNGDVLSLLSVRVLAPSVRECGVGDGIFSYDFQVSLRSNTASELERAARRVSSLLSRAASDYLFIRLYFCCILIRFYRAQ
jgi:hypothetical protein